MKKTILTLTSCFALLFAAQSQIVITEIMYNPPPPGTDTLEYIELYNNTSNPVNISGWHFTEGVTFTFPANTTVPANGYVVVTENLAYFSARFPGVTAFQWDGALTNSGEDIRLTTSDSSQVVDYVDYKNTAPWPTEADGDGASIVLCDPNSDNEQPANWKAASTPTGAFIAGIEVLANPGAASGCPTEINANPDEFTVPANTTTNLDVLGNDDVPNPANTTASITTPPLSGNAVVNSDNTISYTPNNGYCGDDSFYYRICDPSGCDTALVLITIPCYPVRSIEEMTGEDGDGAADSLDASCELTGIVYGINTRASAVGSQFTIIDANNQAGINVFSPASDLGYTVKEGDLIKVRGAIEQFNGLTEIVPQEIEFVSSNTPLSAPQVVLKPDEATESRLIRINNLRLVDTAQWATGQGTGFTVLAVSDDNLQDTISIRIDNDVDLFNEPAPPQPFNLTGIGGQFDSSFPYTSGYQIAPRYIPDVSTLIKIIEADFSANVQLAPNPVSDRLLLQSNLQFDRIRIFAASGVLVKTLENPLQTQEIQVDTLPNGVYFIQFETKNAFWATRFLKQ
jgi:hypothetical protein